MPKTSRRDTVYSILIIIGLAHLLNDSLQALIPAMFPILEESLGLSFTQLGFIAFTLNMVASVMQPVVGMVSDKRPMPYALPLGLTSSMIVVFMLSLASNFWIILLIVLFFGYVFVVFHTECFSFVFIVLGPLKG